jgi:hypothetical protein
MRLNGRNTQHARGCHWKRDVLSLCMALTLLLGSLACGSNAVTGAAQTSDNKIGSASQALTSLGPYGWMQGQPSTLLGRVRDVNCYLTWITGHYAGWGEKIEITRDSNWWWLGGTSQQNDVSALADCVSAYDSSGDSEGTWVQGQAPVNLGSSSGRICLLTSFSGKFTGGGEYVQITESRGSWWLSGDSHQTDVQATAHCFNVPSYTQEYTWTQGQSAVKIGDAKQVACGLTYAAGRFYGAGEFVGVMKWFEDAWYLGGSSEQIDVSGKARCFPLAVTPASFSAMIGAPTCAGVSASCSSGDLLIGRANSERNAPNTVGGSCADGASGAFHVDESIDSMRISSIDGAMMRTGARVRVDATVWAWQAFALDSLDLYWSPNGASEWTYISTLKPSNSGRNVLSAEFQLGQSPIQAIRGVFRGSLVNAAPCNPGAYNDTDDLVFSVDSRSIVATYDATLQVPRCFDSTASCDSGTLLVGEGDAGPEVNAPNMIVTSRGIGDSNSGFFHGTSSIDRLRVYTLDGAPLASGSQAILEARVWVTPYRAEDVYQPFPIAPGPYIDRSWRCQSINFQYARDANAPTWITLGSWAPSGPGLASATIAFNLGTGFGTNGAVVRATLSESSNCLGQADTDDLVFHVD